MSHHRSKNWSTKRRKNIDAWHYYKMVFHYSRILLYRRKNFKINYPFSYISIAITQSHSYLTEALPILILANGQPTNLHGVQMQSPVVTRTYGLRWEKYFSGAWIVSEMREDVWSPRAYPASTGSRVPCAALPICFLVNVFVPLICFWYVCSLKCRAQSRGLFFFSF